MFDQARLKYIDRGDAQKELQKIKSKIASVQNQIEATTERIIELPKGIDARVFYSQILRLQESRQAFENQLAKASQEKAGPGQVIDFAEFQKFSEGLKKLTDGCTDPNVQASIIRKLVDRIEVTPNSVIIHYHVGEMHFKSELAGDSPIPQNKKSVVESTKPVTKPLFRFSTDFSSDAGSNTLKNGRG